MTSYTHPIATWGLIITGAIIVAMAAFLAIVLVPTVVCLC